MSTDNERDWEAEARVQGWDPDYDGPGAVDAEEFVRRGEQYVTLLKPRLDKLEQALANQRQLNEDFKAQIERERAAKAKEIEKLEADLKKARRDAVTSGDGDAYDEAEARLEEIQQYKQENAAQSGPENTEGPPPQWAVEWQQENEWYGTDRVLTSVAEAHSEQLRAMNPQLTGRAFLDQVTELVKAEMPHKFQPSKKKSDVEGDGGNKRADSDSDDPSSKDTTWKYKDLPQAAKKECNRLLKEGVIKDREEYAKYYFE